MRNTIDQLSRIKRLADENLRLVHLLCDLDRRADVRDAYLARKQDAA